MNKLDKCIIKNIIIVIKNKPSLYKHFNFSYKTQKYRLEDILPIIIDVLKYGLPWRYIDKLDKSKFRNTVKHITRCTNKNSINNIHWSTVHKIFLRLNSMNIFKDTYKELLTKYIKKSANNKLKFILSDTSTVYNKYNADKVKRNAYFKNKKVVKITAITEKYGMPLHIDVVSGNHNDVKILKEQLDNELYIDINSNSNMYFLADKGYDGEELRTKLIDKKFIPIIDYNIRNTKNPDKIKKLTTREKKLYKNRIRVENLFAKIKMRYNRLNIVNEKKIKNYIGFLFLALCFIISNEI